MLLLLLEAAANQTVPDQAHQVHRQEHHRIQPVHHQDQPDPAYAQFRDQSRFWIQRVAVPMLMVIGLFGNLITMIIMTRRRMRSTTNMYLAALAFVDMLYLILTFLLGLSHYPNMANMKYYVYWRVRPFLMMLTDACSNTSVWLTVSFTIERFIAVRYPMKGKIWCTEARAKKLIMGVFAFAIIFASPVPFEWKVIEKRVTSNLSIGRVAGGDFAQLAIANAGNTNASGYTFGLAEGEAQPISESTFPILTSTSRVSETVEATATTQSTLFMVMNGPDGRQSLNDSLGLADKEEILSHSSGGNTVTNVIGDWNSKSKAAQSDEAGSTYVLALDYSDFGRNETYKTIYYWSTAVIFYFIPLFSLMLFNGFLIKSVHHSQRERTKMTIRSAPRPNELGSGGGGGSSCAQKQWQQSKLTTKLAKVVGSHVNGKCPADGSAILTNNTPNQGPDQSGSRVKTKRPLRTCDAQAKQTGNKSPCSSCIKEETSVHESSDSNFNNSTSQVSLRITDQPNISQRAKPEVDDDHHLVASAALIIDIDDHNQNQHANRCDNPLKAEGNGQGHSLPVVGVNSSGGTYVATSSGELTNSELVTNVQQDEVSEASGATRGDQPLEGSSPKGLALDSASTSSSLSKAVGPSKCMLLGKKGNATTTTTSTTTSTANPANYNLAGQPAQAIVPVSTQERRITIMLIAVVILFLVCQIPSAAMLLYTSVHETEPNTNEHALVLAFGNIFNFLMAVNAAGNFILYSFLSKKYRRTFMIIFCGCLRPRDGRQANQQHGNQGHSQKQQQHHQQQQKRNRLANSTYDSFSQATCKMTTVYTRKDTLV